MKGNVAKTGRSFKNRVGYILKDDHTFICSNMSADKNNVSDLTDEFKTVSGFRPDIKKPTFHAFLSLPKNEKLTDEQWQEIAKDYLKEMNIDIEKHQYLCVRHKDTDKDHIHIVANRVGLDGSVWLGQHSAFNTIAACERLEVKHGLTITKGLQGQKSEVSAPTKAEIEQALRKGEKPARIVLQNALQAAMLGKPDLQTFIDRVQAVGIEPWFNVASTGNVAGCSFSVGDVAFKGSQLGKKYSWNTIKNKVKYDKNRDDDSLEDSQQEKHMTKIVLDDHLLNQISMTIEPLSETMMILSESVSTALNQTQQTLTRVNNSLEATTTALNSAKNIIDQQAQKLEEQHKKLHKYSTELKNNTIKNQSSLIIKVASIVGVLNLAAVLLVGYLIMQKQPTQPQINLDSREVAVSIVEQLRSKK
ncbi:relaxase/mobilization nuclease domain-containing protein [Enterobacter hormaechei]|uniref:relaxase/mobilization nuclease domain-containing protein n=2 Tax=Enterobacter hormaechei TaxID=158836 RepID=UPI000A44EEF0|nr:relaxase/mobilization nuclease domain-containing protein [Enterobacter hormaechei]